MKYKMEIGSLQPVHKYKLCNKCEEMKPPEGGIEISPTRWSCFTCWMARGNKPKEYYKIKEEADDNRD